MLNLSRNEIIKHWLLNLAIEVPVRLGHLFPIVEGEALNAKAIPGCDAKGYATGLMDLWHSDQIKLTSEVPGDDVDTAQGMETVLDRFVQLSNGDLTFQPRDRLPVYKRIQCDPTMKVSFRLTRLGGEVWERVAEPDWAHFISLWTVETSGELFSPDRDRMIAYMGWYPEVNREQIQLQTVLSQTKTDFEVFYWKRLPFVYHASFEVKPAEARWGPIAPKWFDEWLSSVRSWYKHPWDIPGWPSE
jgi:hypothetical protein